MHIRVFLIWTLVATASIACSRNAPPAGQPRDTCPRTISVRQAIDSSPDGWEPSRDHFPPQLAAVSVFDGHPSEKADLVPQGMIEAGGRRVATWTLGENGTRHYWMSCTYNRTDIVLSRAIAPDVRTVVVDYDLEVTMGGQPVVLKILLK